MVSQVLLQFRLKVNARGGEPPVHAEAVEILTGKAISVSIDVLGCSHGCEEFFESVADTVLDQAAVSFRVDQNGAWKRMDADVLFEDEAVDSIVGQCDRQRHPDRAATDDEHRGSIDESSVS